MRCESLELSILGRLRQRKFGFDNVRVIELERTEDAEGLGGM